MEGVFVVPALNKRCARQRRLCTRHGDPCKIYASACAKDRGATCGASHEHGSQREVEPLSYDPRQPP